MSIEHRANIKFSSKRCKTFTETHQMMKKVYGDDCLAAFTSGLNVFKSDGKLWKMMNVRAGVNCAWIHQKRAEIKHMESELGIAAASIYRILTENLRYIKVCAKFVPHSLKPHEKDLRFFDYLTKYRIVTINHSPYSPDMAPCDFYLFGKHSKGFDRHTQRHTEGWPKKVIR